MSVPTTSILTGSKQSSTPSSLPVSNVIGTSYDTPQSSSILSGSVINEVSRLSDVSERRSTAERPIDMEKLNEERSHWLNQILAENPQILAMREKSLQVSGGFSFANVTHTQTFTALSCIDRKTILELIYQHLQAIGMYRTAEVLSNECGHVFQTSDQPWDRTDLHLLTSIAVGHREDPWNVPADLNHENITEYLEEDFFSSPYREDPKTIWDEYFNPDLNCRFSDPNNHDYQNLTAASLKRLIVYQCTTEVHGINDECQQLFFLTIHSITSAQHFLNHIVELFDLNLEGTKYESEKIEQQQISDLRKSIINLLKKWINYHGLFIGKKTIDLIQKFLTRICNDPQHEKLKVYAQAILKTLKTGLTYGTKKGTCNFDQEPMIKDPQVLFKPSLSILDPEPLEVARQITLIYHKKYASIHSLEFIVALKSRKATIQTQTLNDFFQFGEDITRLVADAYLSSTNKDQAYDRIFEIIKQFKELCNFDAVSCLTQLMLRDDVCAFLSKDPKDKNNLEQKKNKLLEMWKESGENDKYEAKKPTPYETCLTQRFEGWVPCIPNMHAEIKRIDKKVLQMNDYIDGLINWEKMRTLAERCTILYRFQNQAYNYYTIPQIEKVILQGTKMSAQEIVSKLEEKLLEQMEIT
ncbi:RasGEF domain containing protein [Histomonas meleagridis]|uniref:RasGEF domain containing protein n=1 Tax=Histomonas meleagridis TaxID=135588 RepID=UPI00355A7335|nr:RasGEF domain containing protein [Histomonas meleagridis]KAH0797841.1 RasGEF domain containing protein [Histomonas meleagridis]